MAESEAALRVMSRLPELDLIIAELRARLDEALGRYEAADDGLRSARNSIVELDRERNALRSENESLVAERSTLLSQTADLTARVNRGDAERRLLADSLQEARLSSEAAREREITMAESVQALRMSQLGLGAAFEQRETALSSEIELLHEHVAVVTQATEELLGAAESEATSLRRQLDDVTARLDIERRSQFAVNALFRDFLHSEIQNARRQCAEVDRMIADVYASKWWMLKTKVGALLRRRKKG